MDLSGTVQGKNMYRLLAFHEGEKKVFIDKNYSSLTGAKIAFGKKFKNIAWSDKVTPIWTFFYVPDSDWIYEMLSIVEKLKSVNCSSKIKMITKRIELITDNSLKLCLVDYN
jgi:hypothetical protein